MDAGRVVRADVVTPWGSARAAWRHLVVRTSIEAILKTRTWARLPTGD